jgi:hypothetical protein
MTANYELPSVVEKRVRFFDGQFLQEQDFVDEQKYHLDRERRHLSLLHVAGIADGLAVTAKGANQVTVGPGTAIDSDGRQLALAQAATVDLPAETFNDKQGIELYLSYRESAEDQQTEAGSADFTRWLERPQLTPIAPGEAYAGATPPVLLARVALDNAGRVTVDDTARSYSGLRLPGPAADAPTLRSTASGLARLAGSLTVDGNVGIGTAAPEKKLTVAGDLRFTATSTISSAGRLHISGEEILYLLNKSGVVVGKEWGGTGSLTVQGDLQAGGAASVNGNLVVNGNVGIGTSTPGAKLQVSGGTVQLDGDQRLVFTSQDMTNNLKVQLWDGYGFGINSGTLFYAARLRHSWRDNNANERMGLIATADGGLTVNGTGASSFAGSLGVGAAPPARLSVVQKDAKDIAGNAQSAVVRVSAGSLGETEGSEVALSSTGLTVSNSMSLGVRAIRTAKGTDWRTTALGLGMDVDNTVRAGAALFLHANGNVGIGTTAPEQKLTVNGGLVVKGSVGVGATSPNSDLQIGNFELQNRYLALKVAGGNAYRAGVKLWAYKENFGYSIEFDERGATGNGLHIRTHNLNADGESRVFVAQNGNVGIGTTAPEQKLTVNGELRFPATTIISAAGRLHITGDEILYLLNRGGVTVGREWGGTGDLTVQGVVRQGSDARLKKRIRRLERTLERLNGVRGVSYLPRQVGGLADQSEERPAIGVLAQEVEAAFPQLVATLGGDGYKAVDYNGLTAVLLEAVKELKTALDALGERTAALEAHA